MFKNVDRTNITMYTYDGTNYKRKVLRGCIVSYGVEANVRDQGVLPVDSINIQIPLNFNPGYNDLWHLNIGDGYSSDYIVMGTCKFSFTNGLDTRERDNEIREFEKQVKYYKPLAILERTKGSPRMRHIEVNC